KRPGRKKRKLPAQKKTKVRKAAVQTASQRKRLPSERQKMERMVRITGMIQEPGKPATEPIARSRTTEQKTAKKRPAMKPKLARPGPTGKKERPEAQRRPVKRKKVLFSLLRMN